MRHPFLLSVCLGGTIALSACATKDPTAAEVKQAVKGVNVIDESNLNDLMLTTADPEEAVAYFRRALKDEPDRIDMQRGLAKALVRANKSTEAAATWAKVVANPDATNEDHVDYAGTLIRVGKWDEAKAQLDSVPPTHETFKRYRLEAMVADSRKQWKKADSFYEIAVGLTTKPSGVLNNWGFSKLTRGDYAEAERLFTEALKYNPQMFTAKNNIVLARGAQRNYNLPIVPMSQIERAKLLHTMALTAIKQGDVITGKNLLKEAIDTNPQYFEAAVRSLQALESAPTN